MAITNTKIKVRRVDLIEKLKENKATTESKHAELTKNYWSAIDSAAIEVKKALNQLSKLNPADLLDKTSMGYRGIVEIELGIIVIPNEPTLNTQELDKMIRVLEASCDETIAVGVGDTYARYL